MAEWRRDQYVITVANGHWNPRCTASALVRQIGIPPAVATRWQKVRREMSPAGLKKKAYEVRN